MSWTTGLAVYLVIWWLVLFMVLPWGVRAVDAEDVEKGHDAGAPARPRLLIKIVVTSVLAGIVWLGVNWIYESGLVSFRT